MITACERLSHFALTWEFGGDVSWVEVRFFADEASHTGLTLTHTSLLSEHWTEYGPGAVGVGWELGLMGLAIHVAQPNEPKPDEAAFATSPDGKAFITGSSERWVHASVSAGTDPDAAAHGGEANDRVLHRRINLDRLTTDVANRRDSEENVSLAVYGILNG